VSWWPLLSVALALGSALPTGGGAARAEEHRLVQTAGWSHRLKVNLNGSLTYNHHVPGIDYGLSVSFGLVANGGAAYRYRRHRVETGLALQSGWSKTATQRHLLKNVDWAELYNRYRYRLDTWHQRLALLGSVSLGAPLFPGDLVYGEDTDLVLNRRQGPPVTDLARADTRFRITPAFTPLMLEELVGASARPYAHALGTLELRLAVVGLQVWASGYTLDDDRDTVEKELRELQDYQQAGLQLEVLLGGELKKHLTYAFRAELMVPFYTSVDTPERGFDLMNTDLSFRIGLKLAKWASLDYAFGAKRFPMLVSSWQITTQLVLSVTVNI
jgi:hypothetical protein